MSVTIERRTYDVDEMSALLGIHANTIRRVARDEGHILGIPALRVGRRVLFPIQATERVLNGEIVEAADETEKK